MLRADQVDEGDRKMIIASDLDRTLIYSNRSIDEFGYPANTMLTPVENREGKWVSFMTNSSLLALKEIFQEYLFVPVTTRTMKQYQRICIFQEDLLPRFAIISNGANILLNGEPMKEWSDLLSSKMRNETAAIEEIIDFLRREGCLFDGIKRQVKDLFVYFVLNKPLPVEDKRTLRTLLAPFGWNVSLQGRKLYFIPMAINKGDALRFVCSHSGECALAGSGDSILDLDFLKHCHHCFIPNHSELVSDPDIDIPQGMRVTKSHGVLAGEEILNQYLLL
jgi:hydroxymethylpyrimidine pyrophosphatase-like HAD family hydrolase